MMMSIDHLESLLVFTYAATCFFQLLRYKFHSDSAICEVKELSLSTHGACSELPWVPVLLSCSSRLRLVNFLTNNHLLPVG
jgi:hypothetical protein